MRRRFGGATVAEFAVVSSVLGILAFMLMDRMDYYQEWAEKANMESTAASVKSALLVEFSRLMIGGRMQEGALLLQRNPMDWLRPKPANYVGEFDGVAPDTLPRGCWYYDKRARQLVYRVDRGRHFQSDRGSRQEVRFRVTATYDESSDIGASPMAPSGVKLTLVEMYMWF